MRLLLDTHVAIWAVEHPDKLPNDVRDLIEDSANDVFVSAASIWEIAIKWALPRATGKPPFSGSDAIHHFKVAGFSDLPITAVHTIGVEKLPLIHNDPFDRLLVAQALAEPLWLITADRNVAQYSDTIILI